MYKRNDVSKRQISIFDESQNFTTYQWNRIENTWAGYFHDNVFPKINEEPFEVLYSDKPSRPNTAVNILIGLLILKELTQQTDEEIVDSLMFDLRTQYALHIENDEEKVGCRNMLNLFRRRLNEYYTETNIDLLDNELKRLNEYIVEISGIDTKVKRIDSLMISDSCKNLNRIELVYEVLKVLAKLAEKKKIEIEENFKKYNEKEKKAEILYKTKSDEENDKLTNLLEEAIKFRELYKNNEVIKESKEFKILERMINEQYDFEKKCAKNNKEILPTSLQTPYDEDSTYRYKYGNNVGYTANIVEAVGEKGKAIITSYDVAPNVKSDKKFMEDIINAKKENSSTVSCVPNNNDVETSVEDDINNNLSETNNNDVETSVEDDINNNLSETNNNDVETSVEDDINNILGEANNNNGVETSVGDEVNNNLSEANNNNNNVETSVEDDINNNLSETNNNDVETSVEDDINNILGETNNNDVETSVFSGDKEIAIVDAAYYSDELAKKALEVDIEIVPTDMTGKKVENDNLGDFDIDEKNKKVLHCPTGEVPVETRYKEKEDKIVAIFNLEKCEHCPFSKQCATNKMKKIAKFEKTTKACNRAKQSKKMGSKEYKEMASQRSGIEGVNSALRRRYNIDNRGGKGKLRLNWKFGSCVLSINIKRSVKNIIKDKKEALLDGKIVTKIDSLIFAIKNKKWLSNLVSNA